MPSRTDLVGRGVQGDAARQFERHCGRLRQTWCLSGRVRLPIPRPRGFADASSTCLPTALRNCRRWLSVLAFLYWPCRMGERERCSTCTSHDMLGHGEVSGGSWVKPAFDGDGVVEGRERDLRRSIDRTGLRGGSGDEPTATRKSNSSCFVHGQAWPFCVPQRLLVLDRTTDEHRGSPRTRGCCLGPRHRRPAQHTQAQSSCGPLRDDSRPRAPLAGASKSCTPDELAPEQQAHRGAGCGGTMTA